jgi:lipopolysaccharide assembly outer membrane protein LptD (OstA)
MKHFVSTLVVCCLLVLLRPGVASAQKAPGFDTHWSDVELKDGNHLQFIGHVEIWSGDTKFYADKADYYLDTHRLIASGNVTVVQADSSISARAIDFNTETEIGTFYDAWGMASLGTRVDRSMFGTLEPDMYFYGETIEKIAKRKYRITRGGFTTCVQPVPRWELTSGSVVISVDHYAVLTNSVLRVKGVPLFYLPILYYPVKTKEDRATGILLPTYGTSSAHGFTLSNAFFWAMGRSQDLTVMHDWFSKTGQGLGEEYRYARGPGRSGNASFYLLNEHEYTTVNDGTTTITPAKRSYKIDGSATDMLGKYLRASGSVHYFTDVVAQQTYNMNIYDASRSSRTVSGNLSGAWRGYTFAGAFNRMEYFTGVTDSNRTGAEPRISFSRGQQPIGNLPVYVTFGGEYVALSRGSTAATGTGGKVVSDEGLSRVDFSPTIRVPFTKLSFLSVNSSVSWRGTYWSKSWDSSKNFLDQPVSRRLFDFASTLTGPILTRIFTPDSGYAEKVKHSIEPSFAVDYTTAVPDFDRIIQWETIDGIVGGTTRLTYGVTNRLYAKRKREGQVQPAREIVNVSLRQSYYSNRRASQFDPQYSSSFTGAKPFNFSPIALVGRVAATDEMNATVRAEWDTQFGFLRTITAGASYSAGGWLSTSANWNLTRSEGAAGAASLVGQALARVLTEPAAPGGLLRSLTFATSPGTVTHFLNGNANVRLAQNKYGASYSFNYDAAKKAFVQERLTAYYNAQCCGFAVEYQAFNFGNLPGVPVPEDHRLNFSFTLAGIGSFSNFFGALSGAPR